MNITRVVLEIKEHVPEIIAEYAYPGDMFCITRGTRLRGIVMSSTPLMGDEQFYIFWQSGIATTCYKTISELMAAHFLAEFFQVR